MQYLLSSGIAAERMTVNGYGETAPIAENSSPDGRFLNRRVELVVTGTGFLGSAAPVTDTHEHSYVMKKGAPERASSVPADGASMGIATISIVDNAFKPSLLTVPVGTKVTWVNNGGSNHKISFTSGMGPRMRSGAAYEKTFDVAGEYAYECAIHGARMNGKIIVTE
jgi:OOP family OmpA-OmpF porin